MGGRRESADHPQLQPLIDFLGLDLRPSAILRRPHSDEDASTNRSPIFQNGAFADLRWNEDFVRAAVERLRTSVVDDSNVSQTKGVSLRDWQLRGVGGHFEVLVRIHAEDGEFNELVGSPEHAAGSLAICNSPKTKTNTYAITSNDWTQYDVPGLSPWIRWVRSIDWSATELGDITSWSQTLRGQMLNMMANPNARLMIWGPGMTFVYNEACIKIWGEKHPNCFAQPIQDAWAEIWVFIEPIISAVYRGEVMQQHNLPLPIARKGFLEETWFDYTMLPIHGPNGQIDGVIDEIYETTAAVRWNRRRESLVNFGKQFSNVSDMDALWAGCLQGLESAVEDVPFALLYAVVDAPNYSTVTANMGPDEDVKAMPACVLQGSVGIDSSSHTIPQTFLLHDSKPAASTIMKACADACKNRVSVALNTREDNMPDALQVGIPGRAFGETVNRAVVIPIVSISGNNILGIMIIGLNPRSPFDEELQMYIDYLGDLLTKAASLISLPQEQKRAQQISNDATTALSAKLRLVTLQAERSEAKFARMAAEAPTGMFVYSADGRPLYVNDEYLRIVEESREAFFEHSRSITGSLHILHEDDVERFREAYRQLMEQKVPVTVEYRLKKPWTSIDKATGQEITGERWLTANAFPDLDYDGNLQSLQGWVTDISYRVFTEKLVSRKLEEALESKRLTENFIDMTSHEMRNPLSAMLQSADSIVTMISAADTLAPSQPRPEQACTLDNDSAADILDAAQTIVLCAQHQKRIVDDILTLSKLDASLLEMCPEKVRLPPLLSKAFRMFEAEIARVDTQTELIVEPSYNDLNVDWVVLDASRLLQIIINLVTNSIKFVQDSDTRHITLALGASYERPTGKHHGVCFVPRRHEETVELPTAEWGDGEDVFIQIAVTDTGRGLSEDDLKLLFHRFSQGSPKTYKQVSIHKPSAGTLSAIKTIWLTKPLIVWWQRPRTVHLAPVVRNSRRPDRSFVR